MLGVLCVWRNSGEGDVFDKMFKRATKSKNNSFKASSRHCPSPQAHTDNAATKGEKKKTTKFTKALAN
jgi:hypothetical protein